MPDFRFRAFISYSHADEQTAKWLHQRLENYRLPRQFVASQGLSSNRLGTIFRDRDELASSDDLSTSIKTALGESENLIVICTPDSASSNWVNEEIKLFKQIRSNDRVFCVLAGDPDESFPEAALISVDADGTTTRKEKEPLAADIRPDGDGKTIAIIKLVAGMLNARFDDLRRREQQRRNRRFATITVASLTAMVAALVLATLALLGQREAEHQRQLAQAEAKTAQQVTEFLVDLFQAADPFAETQADLRVSELLKRGTDQLETGLIDEPALRSRLLATIGQVYTQLGSYDEARKLLDDALTAQKQLLNADDRQLLRTQISRAWLAVRVENFEYAQGIYNELLPELKEGESYLDYLQPSSEWTTVLNDLGVLQWSIKDLQGAKFTLNEALSMAELVYGERHHDVAVTLNNLGLVYAYDGQHELARPYYERALSIDEELLGPDHPGLIYVLGNFASTVRALGEYDKAEALLRKSLQIATTSFEPDHPIFAFTNNGLGIVLLSQKKYDSALAHLELAGNIYGKAYGEASSGVATNLQHQARVLHAQGKLEESKLRYELSAKAGEGHGPGTASELAAVLEELGDLVAAQEHHVLANQLLKETFGPDHKFTLRQQQRYQDFLERNGLTP